MKINGHNRNIYNIFIVKPIGTQKEDENNDIYSIGRQEYLCRLEYNITFVILFVSISDICHFIYQYQYIINLIILDIVNQSLLKLQLSAEQAFIYTHVCVCVCVCVYVCVCVCVCVYVCVCLYKKIYTQIYLLYIIQYRILYHIMYSIVFYI